MTIENELEYKCVHLQFNESEAAVTTKSLIRRDARGDRFTQFFVRVKHSPFNSHPHFRRQV